MKKNILVVGPSSSGKSTYINTLIQQPAYSGYSVFMAHEFPETPLPIDKSFLHYNLFNAYEYFRGDWTKAFERDLFLKEVLTKNKDLEIHLIVTSKTSLTNRMLLRKEVEPVFRNINNKYPAEWQLNILFSIDYVDLYKKAYDFFRLTGCQIRIINGVSKSFKEILNKEHALTNLSIEENYNYSKSEIEYIVTNFRFEYQQIDLPCGISTKGDLRKNTLEYIFKGNLEGKSILDVGCAYGYFCFEAEKYGAKRILGTELKTHRFVGANILKTILKSKAEFINRDIIKEKLEEKFDVILLLNVIHHLEFPFYSLKVLSDLCLDTLIIEFPTTDDVKFKSTLKKYRWFKSSKNPYVGVSLLKEKDQTFVFNEEALKRAVVDNFGYFKSIEFHKSPFNKKRKIAICKK